MPRLLKTQLQKRTEQIKRLLLAGKPFEQELGALYTEVCLAGKHTWNVQLYQLLLLYAPDKQKNRLLHPNLLQSFVCLGLNAPAQHIARQLLKTNPQEPQTRKLAGALHLRMENNLPPYTPLAALSRYAEPAPRPRRAPNAFAAPPWLRRARTLTEQEIQQTGYFQKRKQLSAAPRRCRAALLDIFDELDCAYLLGHGHAVAALSGAMLEILLAWHLRQKLKISKISLPGKKAQPLLDCHLSELIALCAEKALLKPHTLKLLRAARMQRNYIHPGREMGERGALSAAGVRVCFLAVLETIDEVFP